LSSIDKKKPTIGKDIFIYLPAKIIEGLVDIFKLKIFTDMMTDSNYGDFTIVTLIAGIANILLFGWLANSMMRFVASADENKQDRKNLFSTISLPAFFISLATAILCAAATFIIPLFNTVGTAVLSSKDQLLLPLATGLVVIGYGLFQIVNSALIQLRKKLLYVSLSLYSVIGKLAVGYIAMKFLQTGDHSAIVILLMFPVIDLSAALVGAIGCKMFKSIRIKAFSFKQMVGFFKFGFPLIGIGLAFTVLAATDKFLITSFIDKEAAGIYNASYSLASGTFMMIMIAIMRASYPSILKAMSDGGLEAAKPVSAAGARLFLIISAPCACGLLAVSSLMGDILFNKAHFKESALVAGIVGVGMVFYGLTEYISKTWELVKRTMPVLVNLLIALAINVILNCLTIGHFGYMAAAVNTLITYVLYFLISLYRGRKIMKFALSFVTVLKISGASLLCGSTAFLCTLLPLPGLIKLMVSILAGAVVYAVTLTLSGEIRNEINLIKKALFKKKVI